MKRFLLISVIMLLSAAMLRAQEIGETVDTLSYNPSAQVDSTLRGMSLEGAMPMNVTVKQATAIRHGLTNHIARNNNKMHSGFRIRIYYDNSQFARGESEKEVRRFRELYPDIAAYRSFANTYFKVVVGDFRSRIDAEAALQRIGADFPSAAIIREKFKYPAL